MSTLALEPSRSLTAADLLKLRKRRGLAVVTSLLGIVQARVEKYYARGTESAR